MRLHNKILFLAFVFLLMAFSANGWRRCIKVLDGDTIVLDGNERVRLIGVDCPESGNPATPVEFFSEEAAQFTRNLIEGRNVRLEYDINRFDVYGRTLAYVYLEDSTFVNEEIIKQGFGYAYTQFPFKYAKKFVEYEKNAKKLKLGLWNIPTIEDFNAVDAKVVFITRSGRSYHRENCIHLKKSKIPISFDNALLRGYRPCSVCDPPNTEGNDSTLVYVTPTGKKYHLKNCTYLRSNKEEMTLSEACRKGYKPCSRCMAPKCKKIN